MSSTPYYSQSYTISTSPTYWFALPDPYRTYYVWLNVNSADGVSTQQFGTVASLCDQGTASARAQGGGNHETELAGTHDKPAAPSLHRNIIVNGVVRSVVHLQEQSSSSELSGDLYTPDGRHLWSGHLPTSTTSLYLDHRLPGGVYFLRLRDASTGAVYTNNLVIPQ